MRHFDGDIADAYVVFEANDFKERCPGGRVWDLFFFYRFYFIEVRIAARVIQITAFSTLRPEVERAGVAGEHSGGHSSNANTPRRTTFTTFNWLSSVGSLSSDFTASLEFSFRGNNIWAMLRCQNEANSPKELFFFP